MVYVAYVLNRMADPSLGHLQPIYRASGNLGDISAITTFQWMEPVYFRNEVKSFPDSTELFGYFVRVRG